MAAIFFSILLSPFIIIYCAILIGLIAGGAALMVSAIKDAKKNGWVARNNVSLGVGVPLLILGLVGTVLLFYEIIHLFFAGAFN